MGAHCGLQADGVHASVRRPWHLALWLPSPSALSSSGMGLRSPLGVPMSAAPPPHRWGIRPLPGPLLPVRCLSPLLLAIWCPSLAGPPYLRGEARPCGLQASHAWGRHAHAGLLPGSCHLLSRLPHSAWPRRPSTSQDLCPSAPARLLHHCSWRVRSLPRGSLSHRPGLPSAAPGPSPRGGRMP